MSDMIQLNPPIELRTPKGIALCHFIATNGAEANTLWVCFEADGQIWWWPNHQVRAIRNFSMDRTDPEAPAPIPALERYKVRKRRKGRS